MLCSLCDTPTIEQRGARVCPHCDRPCADSQWCKRCSDVNKRTPIR